MSDTTVHRHDGFGGVRYVVRQAGEHIGIVYPPRKGVTYWAWSAGDITGTGRDQRECVDLVKLAARGA